MKKNILPLIFLILSFGSYAQGEANIWYFGYYAGLDFNSGSPVVLNDSKMFTPLSEVFFKKETYFKVIVCCAKPRSPKCSLKRKRPCKVAYAVAKSPALRSVL